jgi:thiamine-monophosphate kinase
MTRSRPASTLAEFGELRLIAGIRRWLGAACPAAPGGIGDDCAVRPPSRGRQLVTVDPVIRGRHFDAAAPAGAVAAKLLKRNLSDIAAMGGTPRSAVVTLAAPPNLPVAWMEAFFRALGRQALRFGVAIVGGDCAQTDGTLAFTLTLLGDAPERPLLRTGAQAGDLVMVTGALGGSILGKHFRFVPRLHEGRWLAGRPGVHAAIDVSDGLGKDLRAIVPAGLRCVVDPQAVPVSAAARQWAKRTGRHPLDCALNDGEDFELLFAVAPGGVERFAAAWFRRFSTPLSCVGRMLPRSGGQPVVDFAPALPDGVQPHGYEHFH